MILDDKLIVTKDHADASSTSYASIDLGKTSFMSKEYDIIIATAKNTMSASDVIAVVTADNSALSTNAVTIASYTVTANDNVADKILLTIRKGGLLKLKKYLGIKCTTCTADEAQMILVENARVAEVEDVTI